MLWINQPREHWRPTRRAFLKPFDGMPELDTARLNSICIGLRYAIRAIRPGRREINRNCISMVDHCKRYLTSRLSDRNMQLCGETSVRCRDSRPNLAGCVFLDKLACNGVKKARGYSHHPQYKTIPYPNRLFSYLFQVKEPVPPFNH